MLCPYFKFTTLKKNPADISIKPVGVIKYESYFQIKNMILTY